MQARQLAPFERFSEDAQRAVVFARIAVSEHGGTSITDGHLLLGLLQTSPAVLSFWLDNPRNVQALSECVVASIVSPHLLGDDREVPMSPTAERVLKAAVQVAEGLGAATVTPAHILLALKEGGDGPIKSCLLRTGAALP